MSKPERFDDDEVTEVWRTPFAAAVFNAYTFQRQQDLVFSRRLQVVRAMLRAMLDEEAVLQTRGDPPGSRVGGAR
jgi:hypothetical protein